ncbi:hypothetical protein [Streptomyces sioyaensis]|uniref:hypothetical protein n=1 Tax=Streptomyces sioyaensis TaxID=67364 RepID=UPI0037B34C68
MRRLYMTATPRLWQLGEEESQEDAPGALVASMEDDPASPFGSRCFTLTLSAAIDAARNAIATDWTTALAKVGIG